MLAILVIAILCEIVYQFIKYRSRTASCRLRVVEREHDAEVNWIIPSAKDAFLEAEERHLLI